MWSSFLPVNKSSILVIDDDPITCEVLAGWSTHCGARCATAHSVVEAESRLAEQEFDLVLCDVHLPGNRSLAWVRNFTTRPAAPAVVLITGSPELESTLAAANLGIGGYLIKPLDFSNLKALAQRLIDSRRQQRHTVELARTAAQLLAQVQSLTADADPLVKPQLSALAEQLQNQSAQPRPSNEEPLRQSLVDAIAVLEKTKHSFRSKELGELRRRLQQTLDAELATN